MINFVCPVRVNNLNNKKTIQNNKSLKSDKISFSGISAALKNTNIKAGYELGVELYNNPNIPLNEILEQHCTDLTIAPILRTRKDIGKPEAFIVNGFSRDIEPTDISLHSIEKPKTNSKNHKMIYASTIAHEYTHYKQLTSKEDIDFYKNISGKNHEYLAILLPMRDMIFHRLEKEKFNFIGKFFNLKDKINVWLYLFLVPRKISFKKSDILKSGGLTFLTKDLMKFSR